MNTKDCLRFINIATLYSYRFFVHDDAKEYSEKGLIHFGTTERKTKEAIINASFVLTSNIEEKI